jgi:hypothetical protein
VELEAREVLEVLEALEALEASWVDFLFSAEARSLLFPAVASFPALAVVLTFLALVVQEAQRVPSAA